MNRTGFLGDLIAWEDGVYGTFKLRLGHNPLHGRDREWLTGAASGSRVGLASLRAA